MATEIEHKFEVVNSDWKRLVVSQKEIVQGYFLGGKNGLVRIRVSEPGFLTITFKGKSSGLSRPEIECPVQTNDGDVKSLLSMCDGSVVKTRYIVPHHSDPLLKWEIDEFHDLNEGLLLAEMEVPTEDYEFDKPAWIGQELVEDRYNNANLVSRPFSTW